MNLDIDKLLARTEFHNKECISETLKRLGVISYNSLQNLPGKWGKPFLCGEGTNQIVEALNKAIEAEQAAIPSIEELPVAPEVVDERPKSPVVQETPLAELELPGVPDSARKKMAEAEILTVGDVLKDDGQHLTDVSGIGEQTKERIVSAVKAALEY